MNAILVAGALGAVSGSRSMLAPALVARAHAASPAPILAWLAGGEMIADKMPFIPSRTDPLPLVGRIVSGALAGASACGGRRRVPCALAGAAGAVVATFALVRLRQFASARRIPNVLAGAIEDALAIWAGTRLLRR
jgi:uncharacterized membrane protein